MKKLAFVICIILSVIFVFCGCDREQKIARTPEEEYTRIQNIDGEGIIFNFNTLQKLQIKQSVKFSSPEILAANNNKTTEETLLFQIDATNSSKVKTFSHIKYLNYVSLQNVSSDKISYTETQYGYKDSYSIIGGYFPAYSDYLAKNEDSPDSYFRKSIALMNTDFLENFSGKKSFGTYTMTVSVKADKINEFWDWFLSFYKFVKYKDNQQNPLWFHFKPETVKNMNFTIKSNAVQLLSIETKFEVEGFPSSGRDLSFEAVTSFSKSGFDVNWNK